MTQIAYISGVKPMFPEPSNNRKVLFSDGDTNDIISAIKIADKESANKTIQNPKIFVGPTRKDTFYNIWKWIKQTVPYKEDPAGKQNIKSPAQSIKDGMNGICTDCKSYAILVGSILKKLNIPFEYNFVINYGADREPISGNVHHVYIIAKDENGKEIAIDPVLSIFNFQNAIYHYKRVKPYGVNAIGAAVDPNATLDDFKIVIGGVGANNLQSWKVKGTNTNALKNTKAINAVYIPMARGPQQTFTLGSQGISTTGTGNKNLNNWRLASNLFETATVNTPYNMAVYIGTTQNSQGGTDFFTNVSNSISNLGNSAIKLLEGNVDEAARLKNVALQDALKSKDNIVNAVPAPAFVQQLNNFTNEQITAANNTVTSIQASQAYTLQGEKEKAAQAFDNAKATWGGNIDKLVAEGKAAGTQIWRQISRFEGTFRSARLIVIGIIRVNSDMAKALAYGWMTDATLKAKLDLDQSQINKIRQEFAKVIQTWKDVGGWPPEEMEAFREVALNKAREDGKYNPDTDQVFPVSHFDDEVFGFTRHKIIDKKHAIGNPVAGAGVSVGVVAAIGAAVAGIASAIGGIVVSAKTADQNQKLVDAQVKQLEAAGTVDANGNLTAQGTLNYDNLINNAANAPTGIRKYLTPTNIIIASAAAAAFVLIID